MDTSGPLLRWCRRWQLEPDGPPVAGHNAVVLPVRTGQHRPAVLRIGTGGADSTAWRALQAWGGDGAVELWRHDRTENVSLLERLDGGRDLDSLPIAEAIEVAAGLRARLIGPPIPGIADGAGVLQRWEKRLRRAATPADATVAALADRCHELRTTAGPSVLVNADLHYRNVLAGTRHPWLVIDPHPIAIEAEFGTASLLWGRWPQADPLDLLEVVAGTGGLDADRVRGWAAVETAMKLLGPTGPRTRAWRAVLDRLTISAC